MSATQLSSHRVPRGTVAAWTSPWLLASLALLLAPFAGFPRVTYGVYAGIRGGAFVGLLVLVVAGFVVAWRHVGGHQDQRPWYTSGFLVSLLIFWAVFPPSWFFLEYMLFDRGQIALPGGATCMPMQTGACADFLARTKIYADLASKIWAAVFAALGAAIAVARR
jgi:hypothetical protein